MDAKEPISSVEQLLDDSILRAVSRAEPELTRGHGTPVSSAKLKSPVLYPEKIVMVAVNYGSHSKEENTKPPSYPYLFAKYRNALIGPGDPIVKPRVSQKVDWEVELAVVIGRRGK